MSALVIDCEKVYCPRLSANTTLVPLYGDPHPVMMTDCPSVNSCIPSVVKVATLSVSDTFSIGALNVTSIGRITDSAVSII
jgi:hypothetical protein